jgi:hypothetical protein
VSTGYPQVIPEVVIDRLAKYIKPEFIAAGLNRPAEMFGGKSAVAFVADGDGTWEQVLTEFEAAFSYQVTQ